VTRHETGVSTTAKDDNLQPVTTWTATRIEYDRESLQSLQAATRGDTARQCARREGTRPAVDRPLMGGASMSSAVPTGEQVSDPGAIADGQFGETEVDATE